jgi:hypothetical protein
VVAQAFSPATGRRASGTALLSTSVNRTSCACVGTRFAVGLTPLSAASTLDTTGDGSSIIPTEQSDVFVYSGKSLTLSELPRPPADPTWWESVRSTPGFVGGVAAGVAGLVGLAAAVAVFVIRKRKQEASDVRAREAAILLAAARGMKTEDAPTPAPGPGGPRRQQRQTGTTPKPTVALGGPTTGVAPVLLSPGGGQPAARRGGRKGAATTAQPSPVGPRGV